MMRSREDLLFNKYDLRSVIEAQEKKMLSEIEGYNRNHILNAKIEDLCDYLENKYRINPIVLHKDKICVKSSGEADIDVSHDYNRAIVDKSKPFYVKGTSITFAIPFDGDEELFYCQASTYTSCPPMAQISGNEILVTYSQTNPDPEKIKSDFKKRVGHIESYIGFTKNDITPFNNSLRQKAKQKIGLRREKILKNQGVVAELGYPVKQTLDVPTTYKVPNIKKKIVIQKPAATSAPFVSEPALDMKNYEAILKIISNMTLVMERSPNAFKDIKEEDLRQHFLVPLNGHFEGKATGETFNYQGKTDILIRYQGKNIFIAECMFWNGPKSLSEKIGQLLRYVSWHDTKTAILVFNRNKEFSKVLEQVPDTVKQHKNFKRQLEYKPETGYRFVLHQVNDKNRELTLTVLAFDIPSENQK